MMDCQRARQILEWDDEATSADVKRSGEARTAAPGEVSLAKAHVTSCRDCATSLAHVVAWDRKLAAAIRHVPLPVGGQEQVQSAVQAAVQAERNASPSGASTEAAEGTRRVVEAAGNSPRTSRRTMLRAAAVVAVAAAVCVAVPLWLLQGAAKPTVQLADLQQAVLVTGGQLPAFDGPFEAILPNSQWSSNSRLAVSGPYGLPIKTASGISQGAVYSVRLHVSEQHRVAGLLVVIPRGTLVDPPVQAGFDPGSVTYLGNATRRLACVSWSEGHLVYLCAIAGSANDIESLAMAVMPRAA